MDIEHVTTKYTGHRVDDDALIAAHRAGGLRNALAHAVETPPKGLRAPTPS